MKKQVIAIGGGGFGRSVKHLPLEDYLIAQTGKSNPNVCFLPQASNEEQGYVVNYYQAFTKLGAKPTWLSLFGNVEDGWEDHLLSQDMIYVGGGNTRSMLALWCEWGVDKILKQAYEKGIVLAGVSAGAICWFEQGVTDSVSPLGVLDCLGLIKGSCCPHYDSEPERKPSVDAFLRDNSLKAGIALDDYAAAHYIDGELHQVFSAQENAKGYWVKNVSGESDIREIA